MKNINKCSPRVQAVFGTTKIILDIFRKCKEKKYYSLGNDVYLRYTINELGLYNNCKLSMENASMRDIMIIDPRQPRDVSKSSIRLHKIGFDIYSYHHDKCYNSKDSYPDVHNMELIDVNSEDFEANMFQMSLIYPEHVIEQMVLSSFIHEYSTGAEELMFENRIRTEEYIRIHSRLEDLWQKYWL